MYDDLKGKKALITGSGKPTGIGFAIAEKLASNGCHVVISDLAVPPETDSGIKFGSREELQKTAEDLKERFQVDVLAVE